MAFVLAACDPAASRGTGKGGGAAMEDPPIITSATYQHTLYNGKPQPIEARAAREGAPLAVTYFPSREALEKDDGGTSEPPVEVGDYYARIERPAGGGFAAGRSIPVEYHVQKALVTIGGAEKQEAPYDGLPKTVTVWADQSVSLNIVYYPAGSALPLSGPPIESGEYLARVSFAGDGRYLGALREIKFSIAGPAR
ncbi:MAG: hypothetical protein LBQ46_13135 [Treponema sp.]|nr:hypothetical protein [Treponema sp.]